MRSPVAPILPGGTLGVLGAGQLGRMFGAAAVRMGYRVHLFAPDAEGGPARAHAERAVAADWGDERALARFARRCDAVTLEFENVPPEALERIAVDAPVRPGPHALAVCRHRIREKRFLAEQGLPTTEWARADDATALDDAVRRVGTPAILKTAGYGYDGKGQAAVDAPDDAAPAWAALGGVSAVLEARVALHAEISVLVARDPYDRVRTGPTVRNVHQGGILDHSVAPSGLDPATEARAHALAEEIVRALELVGVACVEFFLAEDGRLLVNEIAPRPHNSGHLTIEAGVVSQFEQQVRAVAGLPLGDPSVVRPAAMANLLGDLWVGGEPRWAGALDEAGVTLHLYGKAEARPGRKMGHLTAVALNAGEGPDDVRARALRARDLLTTDR